MSAQTRRALQCFNFQSPTLFALLTTAALASSAATLAAAEPAANPGHALSQRFAEDTERARAADAAKKEAARKAAKARQQKSLEDEMIARARAEAEERRQIEAEASRLDALRMAREAKDSEAARQAAAKRQAEEERVIGEARRVTAEKELEARRIEAERLAAETRRAQNERLAEEGRRAEAERIQAARKAEEVARVAAETRKAEQAAEARRSEQTRAANEALRIAAEKAAAEEARQAARRADETQREVKRATDDDMRRVGALEADSEVDRVAARLRAIREQDMARHMPPAARAPEPPTLALSPAMPSNAPEGAIGRLGIVPPPAAAPDVGRTPDEADEAELHQAADLPPRESRDYDSRAYGSRHDGRVTVLLQMDPISQRGRRHESMDPILCVTEGCYVSNGPHHPASFLPGRRATRFGNAIGRRAGACNHAYTCVFRDVEIGALPAEVQPVDIRVLRHDRRTPETIETLSTCRGAEHRLACTGAIHGDGYTMWVIPESVAARLPVDVFGTTVESNLGREPYAAVAPRRGRW